MFTENRNLVLTNYENCEYRILEFDISKHILLVLYKKHEYADLIVNILKSNQQFNKIGIYSFKYDDYMFYKIDQCYVNNLDELVIGVYILEKLKNEIQQNSNIKFNIYLDKENMIVDLMLYIGHV